MPFSRSHHSHLPPKLIMLKFHCRLLSALSIIGTFASADAATFPQVQLRNTTVISVTGPLDVEAFGGECFTSWHKFLGAITSRSRPIPFASPPIGDLHFRPPVEITQLSGPTSMATMLFPIRVSSP